MSNFSIEPYYDPIKQWRYFIANDVSMRLPYDFNDPLFLQKVSILQAEQVKHMMSGNYYQTAAFREETNTNLAANRQSMEKGMNMIGDRISMVGGMITKSMENGFAAMNYGFTNLSNKADIANAYLLDINNGMNLANKYSRQLVESTGQLNVGMGKLNAGMGKLNAGMGKLNTSMALSNLLSQQLLQSSEQLNLDMALSNQYSQQLVASSQQLNVDMAISNQYLRQLLHSSNLLHEGVARINYGMDYVNTNLLGINNNLLAINKSLFAGFSSLSVKLSVLSAQLNSILEELKIPETQRERRYHIQEGLKYLAQATKDNDDLYFEDALDEFNKAISIESKDYYSHYYVGYIYLYSKQHLDIEKAIEHFRRFIHYAKAVQNTSSTISLWDEACFNLSLGYYLQGKVNEAIQIASMQSGDSEKLLLQLAKYLSLGNDSDKQKAILVVNTILHKNPYAVMLIMQDKDVLMNPYLPKYLDRLRDDAYEKAQTAFESLKFTKKSVGIQIEEDKAFFEKQKRQNTFLSAVLAQRHFAKLSKLWECVRCVKVEGGSFWMGAQSRRPDDTNYDPKATFSEGSVHLVTLNDFYMGESLVSQAFWNEIMGSNQSTLIDDDFPITNVSWDDCQKFINKLNNITKKKFRLPSEAEWEYAAKGGKNSKGFKYAGSNILDEVAWYNGNSNKQLHPIKMKSPNELGIYDMCGLLKEWCFDWFKDYLCSQESNPFGPPNGSYRVLRGGSWRSDAEQCRLTFRDFDKPNATVIDGGLRLALSI